MSSAARIGNIVAPLSNRYFLFNFFEQPLDVARFKAFWKSNCDYVKTFEPFLATYLHHSNQPSDKIRFPWVNFAVSESADVPYLCKPDENWSKRLEEAQRLKHKAFPVGCREIASFRSNPLVAEDNERPTNARFFITAIRVKENIPDGQFEENWQQWSGAEYLHNQLKEDKNLVDTHFYKGFKTKMDPFFRYVWKTEMKEMDDATGEELARSVGSHIVPANGVETFTGFYNVAIPVKRT